MKFLKTLSLLIVFSQSIKATELPGLADKGISRNKINLKSNEGKRIKTGPNMLLEGTVSPHFTIKNSDTNKGMAILKWDGKVQLRISKNMNIIFSYN